MKKPILLLVDDEPNILLALQRLFEDDNYEIHTASSGADALKILEVTNARVIISDQRMPHMSGTVFLTQVKKLYPNTIRIILSGYSEFDSLKSAINDGAIYKFFAKPWDDDLLRKTIQEAFAMEAQLTENEQQRLRLINFAKLTGLDVNKYNESDAPTEPELLEALESNQFFIQYQPIVTVETENIHSVEALIYWQHPTKGLLGPDYFIPLAEETGIIAPITAWLLNSACLQLKQWQAGISPNLCLAVNLTSYLLDNVDLVKLVTQVVQSTQISAAFLQLEITESLIIHNIKSSIVILQQLQNLGVQISIDDFGTGHSSLSYLQNLPVNILKIDKSFVQNTFNTSNGIEIITSIVNLAKRLKLSVITEGVETREDFNLLKKIECEFAQGYLFSKPVSAAKLTDLLKADQAKND
jgi:EAL domain-containing protein (putative c-di-GMP-specific phosphodiesterase class I)/FixJ family two-component response regulator